MILRFFGERFNFFLALSVLIPDEAHLEDEPVINVGKNEIGRTLDIWVAALGLWFLQGVTNTALANSLFSAAGGGVFGHADMLATTIKRIAVDGAVVHRICIHRGRVLEAGVKNIFIQNN